MNDGRRPSEVVPAKLMNGRIDREAIEQRRTRLTKIFTDIIEHAGTQSLTRCPYRDRRELCTAQFGCRNQGPLDPDARLHECQCDGVLDYRSAWETEDADAMLASLRGSGEPEASKKDDGPRGSVSCIPAADVTLFDLADAQEYRLGSSCGRTGSCHECVVEVLRGSDGLSPKTSGEEFLPGAFRLACQARVVEEVPVEFVSPRRALRILTDRKDQVVQPRASVVRRGDDVCRGDEVIDRWRGRLLGLAVDAGTTTIATELVDLQTGSSLCRGGFENPQRFGGSDVISRISYDAGPYRGELHSSLIKALNSEILAMCRRTDVSRHAIYEIVIVGNSTMRDLVFGLDVQSIGQKPYKSLVEHEMLDGIRSDTSLQAPARELGVVSSAKGVVYSPPLVASHVGSDVAADLVATGFFEHGGTRVLLDIGTNTEVVIATSDRIVTASCPAGPAFEGGLVDYGVPACDGAIDSVRAVGEGFQYTTLGDAEPIGLCGSGLIDLLAELRRTGQMTEFGVFGDKAREISIVDDPRITLSRQDASHLAQAKAASYCGQFILLRMLGLDAAKIDRVDLAGGFADSVGIESAISIGFLAGYSRESVGRVGNAALEGARQMLLDVNRRQALTDLVGGIEHVELEATEDFFDIFVEACQFKPMAPLAAQDPGVT